MPEIRKIHSFSCYTILEILIVISLSLLLMTLTLRLFYGGQKTCIAYSEKALENKTVSVIKKSWRNFIHGNRWPHVVSSDKLVFENGNNASIDANTITFENDGVKKYLKIPDVFSASMALEKNPDEPDCLILNLKSKKDKNSGNHIRISASSEQRSTPEETQ